VRGKGKEEGEVGWGEGMPRADGDMVEAMGHMKTDRRFPAARRISVASKHSNKDKCENKTKHERETERETERERER
jgi:hypothetical protein